MTKSNERPVNSDSKNIYSDELSSMLPNRQSIPPFEALRAFDAVARLGGVRRAAQGLMRNHAVVSRHIRKLESWTGTTLVERTTTGIVLTEDGAAYHKKISAAIDAISNATIDLMKGGVDNCLDIWAMPGFAYQWLLGHLAEFEGKNPSISIAIRPTRTVPDFDRREADVDIRFVPDWYEEVTLSPLCKSKEIARSPIIAVASEEYLSNSSNISSTQDFLQHQLIHEKDYNGWIGWFGAVGLSAATDLSGLRLFTGHLTLDAARRGRGIALTNYYVASQDLEAGNLIDVSTPVMKGMDVPEGSYVFVARADRWDVGSIRRFREWLKYEALESPPPKL